MIGRTTDKYMVRQNEIELQTVIMTERQRTIGRMIERQPDRRIDRSTDKHRVR